jgi:hypothetical protein
MTWFEWMTFYEENKIIGSGNGFLKTISKNIEER